jgi:hypothetical protein
MDVNKIDWESLCCTYLAADWTLCGCYKHGNEILGKHERQEKPSTHVHIVIDDLVCTYM